MTESNLCYDLFLIPQLDGNYYMRAYFPVRFFLVIRPFKNKVRIGYDYYDWDGTDKSKGWLSKLVHYPITVGGQKVIGRKSFTLSSSTKDEILAFILSDPAFDEPTRNQIISIFDGTWIKQFK